MFTGIIQAIGRITAKQSLGIDYRLSINSPELMMNQVQIGDSIAVNGVCLTVVSFQEQTFNADVSQETLTHTTLGECQVGSSVNLETAVTPQTPLGGHIVSGHVDDVSKLLARQPEGRSLRLTFQIPPTLAKYIAPKGSVCLDGISLTVNQVENNLFTVNIVPHTLQKTTLSTLQPGQTVNLEVDILARYLERLLLARQETEPSSKINAEFLYQQGFA